MGDRLLWVVGKERLPGIVRTLVAPFFLCGGESQNLDDIRVLYASA